MSRIIRGSLAKRLLAAHLTHRREHGDGDRPTRSPCPQRVAFWVTGVTVYVCWNLGTLIGALAGSAIDPQTYGLDAAFPAGFVAMVAPQLRQRTGLIAGVLGAAICLVLIPFTPVGVPILCSSAAVLVGIPARRDARRVGPRNGRCAVTWTLVLTLAAGAYACKAAGLVVIGSRRLPPALERCLALVPAALISALVVMNTFSTGNDLVDRRPRRRGRRRRDRGMAAGAARRGDRARGGRHGARSTSCRSRLRLPRQIRRSTAVPPSRAAKRPPSHHGNCELLAPREPGAPAAVERLQLEPPGSRHQSVDGARPSPAPAPRR